MIVWQITGVHLWSQNSAIKPLDDVILTSSGETADEKARFECNVRDGRVSLISCYFVWI